MVDQWEVYPSLAPLYKFFRILDDASVVQFYVLCIYYHKGSVYLHIEVINRFYRQDKVASSAP